MRKTKIICTLGPATDNEQTLEKLILAGMNIARINFSHGNYKDQADRINLLKTTRNKLKCDVPLLLDTQGPEIRIGKFKDGKILLKQGETFTLTNKEIEGTDKFVSITYKNLYAEIDIGRTILVNDGLIELKVKEIKDENIICEVLQGGYLTNRKSMNIPNFIVNLPGVTRKDIEDIKYGIEVGFDYIAVSFVRKPEDILKIRQILKQNNGEHIKIISKIENREGVNNFDEILKVSDGIMVARGDLGVEIPIEQVPIYQKEFIKKANQQQKFTITATEMLETMVDKPKPTRAEISDIANAVFDGSSAIMLSAETATGKYPVECVKVMDKVALEIENYLETSTIL